MLLLIVILGCATGPSATLEDTGPFALDDAPCPEGWTLAFTTTQPSERCSIGAQRGGQDIVTWCDDEHDFAFWIPDHAASTAFCDIDGERFTCTGENRGARWQEWVTVEGGIDASVLQGDWSYGSEWVVEEGELLESCEVRGTLGGSSL